MAETVTLVVEAYPFTGATGIEVEEYTSYGWVSVLDTTSIGTFPNYTTSYSVSATSNSYRFRVRWQLGAFETNWTRPETWAIAPTAEQTQRMTQALIAKAARIYALAEAPLGTHGEMTEFGMARVMPDYQIMELLAGLGRVNWDVDLAFLVTVTDVVRALGYDDLPTAKDTDVQRAIDSAVSWVASYLLGMVAIS